MDSLAGIAAHSPAKTWPRPSTIERNSQCWANQERDDIFSTRHSGGRQTELLIRFRLLDSTLEEEGDYFQGASDLVEDAGIEGPASVNNPPQFPRPRRREGLAREAEGEAPLVAAAPWC